MSQSSHQHTIHKMQRYILGSVFLMSAIAISFPIAMFRVSSTKEFPGQSIKSQDCFNQPLKDAKVVEWAKDCASLKVEPNKAAIPPQVEVRPVETKAIEVKAIEPKIDETRTDETKSDETKSDETKSDEARIDGNP